MPVNSKTFSQLVTFSRASGATRVNAAGLIVGVDFSSTSNTIGTGSKTFTLTADAGVNRDWPAGSAIRAVDQVGGGTMNGTVTSYNASTQELVINVASITGSGTSTNWRIGSLEFRRDFDPVTLAPRGGLVEGQATNLYKASSGFQQSEWNKQNASVTPNLAVSPDGILSADKIIADTSNNQHFVEQVFTTVSGMIYVVSLFISAAEYSRIQISFANGFTGNQGANFDTSGNSAPLNGGLFVKADQYPNGYVRCSVAAIATSSTATASIQLKLRDNAGAAIFIGDNTSGMYFWGAQVEQASTPSSYIPTTTVAVTRAADLANIDGTRFSGAYNQSQGTIYVEMTPLAGAVQAVAASINDGTLNNAVRIGQKQSGTLSSIRAIASDGVTDVMAVNSTASNTLRSNGIDYSEVSDGLSLAKFGVATSGVGAFLNAGSGDNMRSTTDGGLTYNERSIGGTLAGAHFGIGRFVIAASITTINGAVNGSVMVSTDGLSFRRINIPGLTQALNEVTSNGTNQYVAVGAGGVIYTSADAEAWTAQTSGTASALTGVAFFGGRYVAVSSTSGASRYSDNGTSWTAVTGLAASIQDVAHNGTNLWVAVGTGGAIYSSADGITWTARTSPVTQNLNGVHFADGLWVAVGNAGTVVTSPDGITWTDRTATSGNTQNNTEVYFFSGFWYNIGASGLVRRITTTDLTNNVTWSAVTLPALAGVLIGIVANGTRLLVCGTNGAIVTSDDGTTFTSRTGNTTTLNGAAFGAGTYVVVGNAVNGSGLIATVDPTTFAYTRRVSNAPDDLNKVRFLNGLFIAIRQNTANGFTTSADGITWEASGNSGQSMRDVAYGNGNYVAVGAAGHYSISANGTNWGSSSVATGATGQTMLGLAFANGLFVAVGAGGTIITSLNGTTWTARTSGVTSTLYAVRWNDRDQCFYAAGDSGVILRSADGITWENIANDAIGASIAGGAIQANPALGNLIPNAINKVAMRYAGNDFAVSVNGADAVADASGSVPAVNRLSLGMSGTGANPFNGYIRKVQYYPVPKSNADLKVLTQ